MRYGAVFEAGEAVLYIGKLIHGGIHVLRYSKKDMLQVFSLVKTSGLLVCRVSKCKSSIV